MIKKHNPQPCPYAVKREGQKIILDNEYTRWVHDLDLGGELTEAVVKNGSNENLLVAPQRSSLGLMDGAAYHSYTTIRKPPTRADVNEKDDGVHLHLKQLLSDDKGDSLEGVTLDHHIRYSPWGYGFHTVSLGFSDEIKNVAQVQIGSLFVRPDLDRCGLRGNTLLSHDANGLQGMARWIPLHGGKKKSDNPAAWNSVLPLRAMMMKRGLEGIELSLGDDLVDWERVGEPQPGRQQFYLGYNRQQKGYELRFCPFDTPSTRFPICNLSGSFTFDFRVSLPYIKPKILPIYPASGHLPIPTEDVQSRWPTDDYIKTLKDTGVNLIRLHNDGDTRSDGIFWRATDYPPYPADEMKKMDDALARVNAAGITVVPYFSPLEYHPETEGFEKNAPDWFLQRFPGAKIEHNYTPYCGEFGAQMCLDSDWIEHRKKTIVPVLENHAFSGMYYDHCCGLECYNPTHTKGKGHHWSQQRMQELLEWSHVTAGPKGELFLHMTSNENFAAENIATLVGVEEMTFGGVFGPEIFTPQVHFMNTCSRLIPDCIPNPTPADQRKFGLCAILNHAGILSTDDAYVELAARDMMGVDVGRFQRHSVQGEGICYSRHPETGASVYWNRKEALVLVANLTDERLLTEWEVDGKALGTEGGEGIGGKVSLKPMELRKIHICQ